MKTSGYIGIIANSTSQENRLELIEELGEPANGFFAPLEFSYNNIPGGIVPLDIQPHDVFTLKGVKKARKALLAAVDYLAKRGAGAICLAASTKRLAGKSGELVKNRHPEITFTIGDNATNISFKNLIRHIINSENFSKEKDKVACLGGGFLGEEGVKYMLSEGCRNIIMVTGYRQQFNGKVQIIDTPENLPDGVKLFASCTHKYNLQPGSLSCLDENAVIIDVAVPPGVNLSLFNSLSPNVKRYNAGDFFVSGLDYNFSPEILSIPKKEIWYGCFTEAVLLGAAKSNGYNLNNYDFFAISKTNEIFINRLLKMEKVQVPIINFFQQESTKLINI